MNLAWHYTTLDRVSRILADGVIKPATAYIDPREKPVTWFTRRQSWPPSASKSITAPDGDIVLPDGVRVRSATMDEMIAKCGGLARIHMPSVPLIPWPEIAKKAGISRKMMRGLELVGKKEGEDPKEWLGHIGPVQLDDENMLIEVFAFNHGARSYAEGEWVDMLDTPAVN